jgi:hypothetical protein
MMSTLFGDEGEAATWLCDDAVRILIETVATVARCVAKDECRRSENCAPDDFGAVSKGIVDEMIHKASYREKTPNIRIISALGNIRSYNSCSYSSEVPASHRLDIQ